ncbi:MAG: rhomboid family intramembrane serine protease [Thaumarchaeota archaeon]|nr:rhomboid family intramembrane serine protease [Candidatus Calditenuaceae archaeon]MDW8042242.1 rhomboid family intramembrane serine protease [Nitrososphaerota archaeon]
MVRNSVPIATYSLIVANSITFIGSITMGQVWVVANFGAVPYQIVFRSEFYRLVTSMFLHADFLHILFNMWALFIFGRDIELVAGRKVFLALYFVSGLVGGLAYTFYMILYAAPLDPRAPFVPAIGASGAVFGAMGAFAVLFPTRPLAMFFYFLPIVAPAFVAVMLMGLIQTLLALALPFSQVAYTAHIGGLAVGLTLGAVIRSQLSRRSYVIYY